MTKATSRHLSSLLVQKEAGDPEYWRPVFFRHAETFAELFAPFVGWRPVFEPEDKTLAMDMLAAGGWMGVRTVRALTVSEAGVYTLFERVTPLNCALDERVLDSCPINRPDLLREMLDRVFPYARLGKDDLDRLIAEEFHGDRSAYLSLKLLRASLYAAMVARLAARDDLFAALQVLLRRRRQGHCLFAFGAHDGVAAALVLVGDS